MKIYCTQVLTNEHWTIQLDMLEEYLSQGWNIERADATSEMIVYILSMEVKND